MHIKLVSVFESSPHYDKSKWPLANEANDPEHSERNYDIVSKLPGFEAQRDRFLATLRLLAAKASPVGEGGSCGGRG